MSPSGFVLIEGVSAILIKKKRDKFSAGILLEFENSFLEKPHFIECYAKVDSCSMIMNIDFK